ncbi:class I tRNA ligase family protein [Halosimplex aquaticum]
MEGVETTRERFDVVWNVARFAAMFMAEDDYRPTVALTADSDDRTVLDEWVLARLREVTETATGAFEGREPNVALDATLDFLVEDVSRYYVQTVRDRVWTPSSTADKLAAYDALGTVLGTTVRLLAPFAPHLAERLYHALDGPRTPANRRSTRPTGPTRTRWGSRPARTWSTTSARSGRSKGPSRPRDRRWGASTAGRSRRSSSSRRTRRSRRRSKVTATCWPSGATPNASRSPTAIPPGSAWSSPRWTRSARGSVRTRRPSLRRSRGGRPTSCR